MVITSDEISELLIRLSKNLISREEADVLAIEMRDAYDEGRLIFQPESDEDRIWEAIEFLELFAEKVDPDTYLYGPTDLLDFMKKTFGYD